MRIKFSFSVHRSEISLNSLYCKATTAISVFSIHSLAELQYLILLPNISFTCSIQSGSYTYTSFPLSTSLSTNLIDADSVTTGLLGLKESPKIELYDHRYDPEENINIAAKKMKLVDSLLPFIAKIKPNFYN